MLIDLQRVGHVRYIWWKMGFFCQTLLVKSLQRVAKDMEDELESWNKEVGEAREKFYGLNYFTTCQLLTLRRELGRFKADHSAQAHLARQVIALLESISSGVTLSDLPYLVQSLIKRSKDTPVRVQHPPEIMSQSTIPPVSPSVVAPPVINEPPSLPLARISKKDLNDKQKRFFTDITVKFDYSEKTALKAIEAVGDGDYNDIENWLCENGDECETHFQESEGIVDITPHEDGMVEDCETEGDDYEGILETEADLSLQNTLCKCMHTPFTKC